MKIVENGGLSQAALDRGYTDTGAIPEDGGSISGAEAEARKERKMEREERAMAKKYGWDYTEDEGGFLERNDYDERC